MIRKTEFDLRSFYIFNSNLSHKEGDEHKKVLFYHPKDVDLDTKQIKDIGLSEAIIKFSGTFSTDNGCKALHTQKSTQIFYQPETDFWMVMTINAPKEIKTKDGVDVADYRGGEIHDKIFRAVLKQSYQMFRLFAGTFQMNFVGETEDERAENLRKKLELFFSKYLLTLNLHSSDVVDALRSVQYLPLAKSLFLRVHNFIHMVTATFPTIDSCIFLYNEQLVWSEIKPTDLYSIHEYLIGTLFPMAIQTELLGGPMERNYAIDCNRYGGFITGPDSIENSTKAPRVYLQKGDDLKAFYLVVYRTLNATICLFVSDAHYPTDDFFTELNSYMGPQLSSIASEIGEEFTKTTTTTPTTTEADAQGPRFLLVNELSLMHRGTIYLDHRRPKNCQIPADVMNLIADLYEEDKSTANGKYQEIMIKSVNDYWIVKKTSNWRQFYVIISSSKATLLDITAEAKKLYDQEITTSDVFFEQMN